MGCRNALLPDHLLKERFINCRTCNQNTCDISTVFKSSVVQLRRDERSEERSCNVFQLYMKKKGKVESATFQGVCLKDMQTAEETLGIKFILYDVDTVDGYFVGELVRWSLQKHSSTVRLLCYNSHIYYLANIQALFNALRCSTCECYFCQPIKLEGHSISIYGIKLKEFKMKG